MGGMRISQPINNIQVTENQALRECKVLYWAGPSNVIGLKKYYV